MLTSFGEYSSARGKDLRVDVAPRREKPVSAKFGGCLRGVGGEGLRKCLRSRGRFAGRIAVFELEVGRTHRGWKTEE